MNPKKVIQEFVSSMEKMPHRANFAKLQTYLLNLSKINFNEADAEFFIEAILKYIDVVINISADKGHRDQIKICRQWLDILQDVITNDVRKVFLKKATRKVFDILIEEDVKSWCVKKELLKVFLGSVQCLPKDVRCKMVQELPDIYLFKIVDSISTYGDYDFQVTLIEALFRMYGKNAIMSKLTDLIPESQELSESFANINGDTFDEDVRRFLNTLNQSSKKVFSIVCSAIFLGNTKCGQPMENVNGLWVDFNRSENAVSWYCTMDASASENIKPDALWDLMTFFVSDVEVVQVYRPPKSYEAIIYVKLKVPCITNEGNHESAASGDVKFVVSCSSNQASTLISKVLPGMFKNKFHHNTPKISLGRKVVYKPLNVSVYRRSKSESSKSKSDVSGFAIRIDPVSGKSDISSTRDGSKKVCSASSASSRCEVISISDGSMRSVESCIDLLPSSEQRAQNVQESQYETAEMCPVEHLCKISSSQTGAKISSSYQHSNAVFSERSFSEDIREAQQHIQILSGRCSGSNVRYSQNSVAVSTPKTSEHQERNVLEDFAGHNSSGSSAYFETAKETQQNSSHLIFRKAKLSQSVKPHIANEKKCSTSKSTKEAREANLNREDRGGLNLECEPATSRRGEGNVVESRNDEDDEAVSKLQQRNKKCSIGCTKKSGQSKNYQEGAVCGMEDDPVVVSIEENVTSKETNSRRSTSKYKKSPELVVSDLQDEPATTKMNECKVFDELLLEDVLEHVKNCLQDNEDAPNATKVPREKDSDLQYEAVTCEEGERKILEGIPAECARNSSQMNEVNDLMSQEKGEVGKKCAKSQEEGSKEKTQTGLEGNGEGDFDKKSDEVIVLFDSEVVMPNDASPVEERVPAVKDVKVSEEVQQIPVVSERKQELPNELEANENCHANSEESVIHFKKKMYRRQLSSTTNEDDKEEEREDKSLKELTNIQHVSRKALKKTGKRAKASKNKKRNKRKLENKDKLSNKKIFSAENAENLKSVNFPLKTLNITADTFEKVDKHRTECKGKEDRNGFEIADVEVLNAPQSLTVVEELAKNCVVLLPKHPELEGIDENSSGESKESENPGNATQPTPTPNEDDMIEAGTALQASDTDSMIKKRKYTRQLSASTVENDVQGTDDYRFVEPIHNCEKSFDLLKKQEGEEKSARGDVINNSNLMQEDRLTQRTEIHTCDVYKNDRSVNERACDGGINNPDLIVEDRLTQQTEIHVCDVHGKSDTDDLIVQDKSANNDVDKSNKQQGEERGIVGIKGNVPLTGDVGNRTVFNQTLSTTLGSRKMRKLYNPDDLSYLENVAVMELNKSEDRTERKKEVVSSRMERKETSIAPTRRKVYRRKQAKEIKPKKKIVKPKKLKIINLHTELTTPCNQNIVNLQSTFHKILESFQKEAKTSFSIIMQSNVQKNLIVPEEKNVSKTRKKGKKKCITKDIKRLNSRTKNATTVDRRMRAQVSSDQSEASVNLEKKRDSTDDKTVYNLSDEALFPPAPSTSKINIISDIQVRPKRAMPEDDCGVPAKKMKSVENCSSALEDVISGSISNKEICQWIETGSPNYNQVVNDRRSVLRHCYPMFASILGQPDETEEYKDTVFMCNLLKKYI